MNWYYAIGQERKGPVTDDQLQGLVKDNVVLGDTLVWREGMPNWQPYRTVAPLGSGAVLAATPEAAPLPAATVAPPAAAKPTQSEEEYLRGDYTVSIGYAWSRAWRAVTGNAGVLIGGGLLLLLLLMAGSFIPLASLFITGPLLAGAYWLYLRCLRGQGASVGDGFIGFGPQFLQLMLGHIVPALLLTVSLIPGITILIVGALVAGMTAGRGSGLQTVGVGFLLVGGLILLVGLVLMIYFSISWCMTLLLVLDKRVDFWRAMSFSRRRVGKHFIRVFFFFVVTSVISMLGLLALGVGLLLSVPVAFAMNVCLYEDMFREFDPVPHS